jgi:hypothetical protein
MGTFGVRRPAAALLKNKKNPNPSYVLAKKVEFGLLWFFFGSNLPFYGHFWCSTTGGCTFEK